MAPKDDSSDGVNLSRRNFLKSTGVVGLAATRRRAGRDRRAERAGGARSRRSAGAPQRQRPAAQSDDRAARHAARCAAHARRSHRQQARLRPRRLRRLHDARRRPAGLLLLDAGDRGAGQADSQRRGPRQRRHAASRAAGVLRQGRADVRLLHAGLHHGERRPAREASRTRRPSRSGRASTATSAAAARSRASSKRCRA